MLEEFLLMLESEKEKVTQVLKPHLDEKILKCLIGGFFDESKTRFIAFAFMPIKKSMFYQYDYLFELSDGGHSARYFSADTVEKTKKYFDKDSFQHKSAEELIEEGVYKSLLVSYVAEFDFGEWNILRSCCLSDTNDKNIILKSQIDRVTTSLKDHFLNNNTFQETLEHHTNVMRYVKSRNENLNVRIPTEVKPFIGHSNLVAIVRAKKRSKINLSFREYIKKAIYQPLTISLKAQHPETYNAIWGFYGDDGNFLIPSHRQFCLMIFVATNNRTKKSLEFYFYSLQKNKLYKWIYFDLHPHKEKIDHDVIDKIFSSISQLDDIDYISNPTCNFDDDGFWNNFVLKEVDGKYLYLNEVEMPIQGQI